MLTCWRRIIVNPTAVFGLSIVTLFAVTALLAPILAPHDPLSHNLHRNLEPPSLQHLLGTDELGRDILSRLMHGARLSLFIGIVGVTIGLAIGAPTGLISGYYGGKIDLFIQRITDVLLAFPSILLALVFVATFGVGLQNVIMATGISFIPIYVRLARGCALSIRELEYIEAAKALGLSDPLIIFRHILPNSLTPIIVQSTLNIGSAILIAAGLGFLGLGVQPPTPEWGAMLGSGRMYIFSAPHLIVFPGVAILLSVLAFNLLGDALKDVLGGK